MATNDEKYVDYLDFSKSTWKRPEGPKRIWHVFDGRRKIAGHIPRFCIREVPKELEEEVVDFMVKNYVQNEPICVATDLGKHALAIRELGTLWRDTLSYGISVAAFTVNSDSSAKPVIAGVNVLGVVTAQDEAKAAGEPTPFRNPIMHTLYGLQNSWFRESNVLGKYGADKFLCGFGLSVDRFFKGQGIGEELLRTRDTIGRAYQIPITQTLFSANESQCLASRVGFEVLGQRKYSECLNEDGSIAFPVKDVEFLKLMAKRLY